MLPQQACEKIKKITILQVFTFFIIIVDMVTFLTILNPNQNMEIFFIILSFVLTLSYAITSSIDATDMEIKKCKEAKLKNQTYDDSHLEYFCDSCNYFVDVETKHCRTCKNCIGKFDHHCVWLNCCIGQANYKPFILMIINCFLFLLAYTIQSLKYFTENQFNGDYMSYIQGTISIITGILMLMNFFFIIFHFNLIKNNMTTYQWIIKSRLKSQKINPQVLNTDAQQLNTQNQQANNTLNSTGKNLYYLTSQYNNTQIRKKRTNKTKYNDFNSLQEMSKDEMMIYQMVNKNQSIQIETQNEIKKQENL